MVLLRGINVGGHRSVKMATLRTELAAAGFTDVATYIQSGNIVVRSEGGSFAVAARVEALIERVFGFAPRTLARSRSDFEAAANACPYLEEAADEPRFVHAFFLDAAPADEAVAKLREYGEASDPTTRWQLGEGTVYLHTPHGLSKSKVAERLERTLGVPMTARNWRTIEKLREMAATTVHERAVPG